MIPLIRLLLHVITIPIYNALDLFYMQFNMFVNIIKVNKANFYDIIHI